MTLVLASVLAYEAWQAARSHRATAERALHDNASFATSNVWYNAVARVFVGMTALFTPVRSAHASGAASPPLAPDALVRSAAWIRHCKCAAPFPAAYYFRLALRDGALSVAGDSTPTEAERAWLADTILSHARAVYGSAWDFGTVFGSAPAGPRTVGYTLDRDAAGAPVAAYGFVTTPTAYADSIFAAVWRPKYVLPPSLVGDVPNDSLLSVVVTDALGRTVYTSAVRYPPAFSDTMTAGGMYGGMHVRVSLRPDVAARLVIGGLPRSRLPLILGLLVV